MDSSCSYDHLHVAVLSSPGIGHLIPVIALSNRLASHHHVKVTVLQVTTAVSPPESELLKVPLEEDLVQIIELPPVDISHLVDPSTKVVTQLCLMVREALPFIRSAIDAMDSLPRALFVDLFGTEALPIAHDFNMSTYVYVPSTAWFTALTVYCPVLDQEIKGEYVDQSEHLRIPGCKPVLPDDVVDPMLDRSDQQYSEYVRMGKEFTSSDGILLNSWEELELTTLRAFREDGTLRRVLNIPVYPIGPLRRPVESEGPKSSNVIAWLDRQPNESVLFVSFGSGGMLSAEQITELAWGLELSRQRFVWVVRPPTGSRVDDAFFSVGSGGCDGNVDYLPDGFSTRTRDVGLLVPMWAQQAAILNHPAIGGFLSHCGWNSTLESITSGVPMIAWPLYSEQKMNAAFLVEEVGVALRPRVLPTKQVVGREEIVTLVRTLMEQKQGHDMRNTIKLLQTSGADGLRCGGSSHGSMCEILTRIASKRDNSFGRQFLRHCM